MIEALNICKSFKNGTVKVLKDVSVNVNTIFLQSRSRSRIGSEPRQEFSRDNRLSALIRYLHRGR